MAQNKNCLPTRQTQTQLMSNPKDRLLNRRKNLNRTKSDYKETELERNNEDQLIDIKDISQNEVKFLSQNEVLYSERLSYDLDDSERDLRKVVET